MTKGFNSKLDKIADIWNYFILQYKYCSGKIRFNEDIKTNYFGDILGYFQDTIEIIASKKRYSDYSYKFVFTISFLQAIYVQQDLIEEMLEIFKTGINKGDLKQDENYTINREIRNELVGHPIRKFEGKLISSTLFSYQNNQDEIEYLRYHRDNNFNYEGKRFKIVEIQQRHEKFLEKYFDLILVKLKSILDEYSAELDKLEQVIENKTFDTVLKLVELYFESIFESDFIYDKVSLIKVYGRRNEHKRYQSFIERFYADLKGSLVEKRAFAKDIFEKKRIDNLADNKPVDLNVEIVFTKPGDRTVQIQPSKVTYHYEIGKLATRRNLNDFRFFGKVLKSKCQGNSLVLEELRHMELNIYDEIEYYTALRLISKELREDN
uniref:hypothetical protein n=1 Tax=Pedobacter schmidteae TaxID=2201271 RepID=UPI0013CE4A37|nr:hypothetical protein [Pedobacter schmidteae]